MQKTVCLLFENSSGLGDLAEAFLRHSPQVALGENCLFIEIAKCHRVYSECVFRQSAQKLLEAWNKKPAWGIDPHPGMARALAQWQTKNDLLPIEALGFFLNPFAEVNFAARSREILQKVIPRLRELGIYLLKDFKHLPRRALASRFGEKGLLARQALEGSYLQPWPYFSPAPRLVESEILEEASIRELEPVLFIIKKLMDRTLLRLRGRGELAEGTELRLYQENFSHVQTPLRGFQLNLPFPQKTTEAIFPLLREKVMRELQAQALLSPLTRIEFEVSKRVPGAGLQKNFFSKKEEEEESLKSIILRLREKLGESHTFFAQALESHWPESCWRKSFGQPPLFSTETPVAKRPLRVLSSPLPLSYQKPFLKSPLKQWTALEWKGPEKLSGPWWFYEKDRDYYQVLTEQGERLWLYQTIDSREYYLHGFFD